MFCEKCGKQINDDAAFCPFCGYTIGQEINDVENDESNVKEPNNSLKMKSAMGVENTDANLDEINSTKEKKKKKRIIISVITTVIIALMLIVVFVVRNGKETTVKAGEHRISVPAGYSLIDKEEHDLTSGYSASFIFHNGEVGIDGHIYITIHDKSANYAEITGPFTEDDLYKYLEEKGAHIENTRIDLGDYSGIWATIDENDEIQAEVMNGNSICHINVWGVNNPQEVLEKIKITND